MGIEEITKIVENVSYKDGWSFILGKDFSRNAYFLQVLCEKGVCSVSKEPSVWRGRKQYLSNFVCSQEVVGICFSLIKDAEMHELHEWFRYKGSSIYNPHLDPDKLAELARHKESFVVRENSMIEV